MVSKREVEIGELTSQAHYEELKGSRASKTKLVSLYKHIGKYFDNKGKLPEAEKAYRSALRYARGLESEDEIQEKLNELKTSTKKTLSFLEGVKYGLEKKFVFAFLSVITLISALLFVSFGLTGNTILGLTETNFRWIGICLFACGLTFAFLYFRKKK